jgi:ribosomal protein S18 acetylase RimI-like enzyme
MRCTFCGEPAWYRCARTAAPVCPGHARLEVVAAQDNGLLESPEVRAARPEDRERMEGIALHFWGETEVECFERRYDVLELPALVAELDGEVVGFVSYAAEGERLNLVMLNVLPDHQGHSIAKCLLRAAVGHAHKLGALRLVVATTNDDLPALAFYQQVGFTIEEVVPGRILEHHGGEEEGFAGILVRDEVRLQLSVEDSDLTHRHED